MTLTRARELLEVQIGLGGGYNRNSAKMILADVSQEHGQAAVDQLIRTLRLDEIFDFKEGMKFRF